MEIRGHGGITHFGNSEGKGGLKCGSRPWCGTDIFWNRPICIRTTNESASLRFISIFCVDLFKGFCCLFLYNLIHSMYMGMARWPHG